MFVVDTPRFLAKRIILQRGVAQGDIYPNPIKQQEEKIFPWKLNAEHRGVTLGHYCAIYPPPPPSPTFNPTEVVLRE